MQKAFRCGQWCVRKDAFKQALNTNSFLNCQKENNVVFSILGAIDWQGQKYSVLWEIGGGWVFILLPQLHYNFKQKS